VGGMCEPWAGGPHATIAIDRTMTRAVTHAMENRLRFVCNFNPQLLVQGSVSPLAPPGPPVTAARARSRRLPQSHETGGVVRTSHEGYRRHLPAGSGAFDERV
jgi:hypothetical protein